MAINKKSPKLEPGFLDSLPETCVMYANRKYKAKYDEKNQILYLLDDDGAVCRWVNIDLSKQMQQEAEKTQPTPAPEPPSVPTEEAVAPPDENLADTAPPADEEASSTDGVIRSAPPAPPKEPAPEKKRTKRQKEKKPESEDGWAEDVKEEKPRKPVSGKVIGTVSALLLVVGIGLCVVQGMKMLNISKDTPDDTQPYVSTEASTTPSEIETTAPPVETTVPTEPEVTDPSETTDPTDPANSTYVLTAKETMLPGHVLTAEDFEQEALDYLEYQTLTSGGGFYTKEELDRLEGLVVITYVPAGKYLSYEDVSTYYAPANPWGRTESQQMIITLPIEVTSSNLTSCLWGNYVDITITVETKLRSPNDADNNQVTPPAGIQHQSSTVESILVDTYKLHAAAIVDVLDANRGSLYTRYSALASIPVVFRQDYLMQDYEDLTLLAADTPCYIQIAVPVEQGELLDSLNQENMTVAIQNPTQNNSTDLQSATYASLQEIGAAIARIMESVAKEG